jgi:hypothetical protein
MLLRRAIAFFKMKVGPAPVRRAPHARPRPRRSRWWPRANGSPCWSASTSSRSDRRCLSPPHRCQPPAHLSSSLLAQRLHQQLMGSEADAGPAEGKDRFGAGLSLPLRVPPLTRRAAAPRARTCSRGPRRSPRFCCAPRPRPRLQCVHFARPPARRRSALTMRARSALWPCCVSRLQLSSKGTAGTHAREQAADTVRRPLRLLRQQNVVSLKARRRAALRRTSLFH